MVKPDFYRPQGARDLSLLSIYQVSEKGFKEQTIKLLK